MTDFDHTTPIQPTSTANTNETYKNPMTDNTPHPSSESEIEREAREITRTLYKAELEGYPIDGPYATYCLDKAVAAILRLSDQRLERFVEALKKHELVYSTGEPNNIRWEAVPTRSIDATLKEYLSHDR